MRGYTTDFQRPSQFVSMCECVHSMLPEFSNQSSRHVPPFRNNSWITLSSIKMCMYICVIQTEFSSTFANYHITLQAREQITALRPSQSKIITYCCDSVTPSSEKAVKKNPTQSQETLMLSAQKYAGGNYPPEKHHTGNYEPKRSHTCIL